MRSCPAVCPPQEPVPLQPADVSADRHLRDAELGRELGDVDRLVLGHLLQDPMSAVDG